MPRPGPRRIGARYALKGRITQDALTSRDVFMFLAQTLLPLPNRFLDPANIERAARAQTRMPFARPLLQSHGWRFGKLDLGLILCVGS